MVEFIRKQNYVCVWCEQVFRKFCLIAPSKYFNCPKCGDFLIPLNTPPKRDDRDAWVELRRKHLDQLSRRWLPQSSRYQKRLRRRRAQKE